MMRLVAPASGPARRLVFSAMAGGVVLLVVAGASVAAAVWVSSSAAARWSEVSSGGTPYVFDPELGWVAPPRSTSHRRHRSGLTWSFYRDGRGARVAAESDHVPRAADIVFIGGSFTLGRGVEYEDTFAAIAAGELGLSMCNLGMGGYGTLQSLLMLRRNADLSPDLVVYGFIEDHIRRNLSPCGPTHLPFCSGEPWVDFDEAMAPRIRAPDEAARENWNRNRRFQASMGAPWWGFERVGLGLQLLATSTSRIIERRVRSATIDPRKRAASLELLLGMMVREARAAGARLVVMHIPQLLGPEAGSRPAPSALVSALPADATLLDLSDALGGYGRRGVSLAMLPDDGHPGRAGHRAIAEGLVRHLRETRMGRSGEP